MFELSIIDEFAAAHKLINYNGECANLHGHSFKVQVTVYGDTLNNQEMLIDFKDLKLILKELIKKLDHRFLNEIEYFKQNSPTSENIAKFIFYELKENIKKYNITLKEVKVFESEKAYVSYKE